MAPILLEHTSSPDTFKSNYICSDPSVVPSNKASKRTRELWWLHGSPHSKRYSNPKLVSLAALVRHSSHVYKDQTAFLYPASTEATTPYNSMSWHKFDSVTEAIALTYAYQLRKEIQNGNRTRTQPTVALLGSGTTLEYFCTELALQKLGLKVLLLAESNASNTLHFLLESCHVLAVITDSKNANVDTKGIRKVHMIELMPSDSHVDYCEVDEVKFQDFGDIWERHTFIMHSSGSTGMPKPIIHTNRSMMLIARMYRLFQEFNIDNWFLLFPLYHVAGISIALSALPTGQILSFPPLTWPPAASKIFTAWETLSSMGHPVDCIHCSPTLIENMYDYILNGGLDFSPLSSLKLLQPGGAVLSEHIINDLTAHGVNVKTTYGSTETGPPFRSIPHTRSNPKCYSFRNLYPDDPLLKMEQVGEGLYECVVYKGFGLAAELWQGKSDNEPYRTNDLFIQDPPDSGFYVIQGRKDDIVVHTNGENTSAGALQLDIQNSSKLIHKALALGHSLPCVSLLVEVHKDYDPESPSTQRNIWQTVEKTNAKYPPHSQIMQSMIYILPRGSVLPITPKGNVRRKEAGLLYSTTIAALYSNITTITIPRTTSTIPLPPLSEHIRTLLSTLSKTHTSSISDFTTLYDLGLDSHSALTLRSALAARLHRPISLSFIFEHPSIASLLSALEPKPSLQSAEASEPSTQAIERIIARLGAELNTWPPRPPGVTYPPPDGETVLLTGATGSLGTSLLATLHASSCASRIYCLIRGPSPAARLHAALTSRALPTELLASPKVTVLEYSMQDPLLGLEAETYARLAGEATCVVHGAWKMDFNAGVEGFEGCFRGTQSLLRFCHAGRPKRFAFTSSISTCLGPSLSSAPIPENPPSLSTSPLPTGYAQSKYITERLLLAASTHSHISIPTTLLRVGQLCGHTQTGGWSEKEWVPILVASSVADGVRALPCREGWVDWVPVDVAAGAVGDILLGAADAGSGMVGKETGERAYEVYNIVNPSPIPWSSLISMLQHALSLADPAAQALEEISMVEWVHRLDVLAAAGRDDVPGLKLLSFFEGMANEDSGGGKVFETNRAREASRALRECGPLEEAWVRGNVGRWREVGFLK